MQDDRFALRVALVALTLDPTHALELFEGLTSEHCAKAVTAEKTFRLMSSARRKQILLRELGHRDDARRRCAMLFNLVPPKMVDEIVASIPRSIRTFIFTEDRSSDANRLSTTPLSRSFSKRLVKEALG